MSSASNNKRSWTGSGVSVDKRQRLSSENSENLEFEESEALIEQVDGDDTKFRTGCIYLLTCIITGLVYVGQTIDYKNRMKTHISSGKNPKQYFSRAIHQYGWENFTKDILIDDVPEEDLNNLEINYIAFYNSFGPGGYNCTKGGSGASGYKHTEEQNLAKSKRMTKNHTVEGGGCISFITSKGKWEVAGSVINGGKKNFIGSYLTKKRAEEALGEYNTTGQRILSDIVQRRIGTGSINKKTGVDGKSRFTAIYERKSIGTFDTEGEANDILEKYANGTNVSTFKKKRGSIWKRGKRFRARYKGQNVGTFASEAEAEQALKIHIENL